MHFGVQDASDTFLEWSLKAGWRAGYLPHWILSTARRTRRSPKASGHYRVRSQHSEWATEGVRKAVIHLSGSQSKHGVWVTFLHGALCLDGEGRNFMSPFPQLPIIWEEIGVGLCIHSLSYCSFNGITVEWMWKGEVYCCAFAPAWKYKLWLASTSIFIQTQAHADSFIWNMWNTCLCLKWKKWVVCSIWKIPAKREEGE